MKEKKTPDKGKLLLKSYAMSLLSLMLCVTMLVGTTYAWFTSDVTTGSNEIQVGTLKVDMQDADGNTLAGRQNLFGSGTAKWEPGATWFETVQVKNYGDLAFDYALRFNTVGQEIANIDTVGKYIDVYVTTNGADCKNTEDILTKWVRVGTLADVVRHNMLLTSGSWVPDAKKENVCIVDTVSIALHMPTTFTGFDGKTDLMGKTLSGFGLRMTATQKIHETDGFGNDGYYDQAAANVLLAGTDEELVAAFQAGMDVRLTDDIDLDADTTLVVNSGAKMVLDLNGKVLSGSSEKLANPREMILVKGNLTVKNTAEPVATASEAELAPGVYYKHTGENMGWSAMSTIFDVTAGGVLTLTDVRCENLGGTDMNFVVHLNNWGEASLYTNNAHLEAPYCAVRVFNSGYDMNNVVARNSTLKSNNMALWVHNYTQPDFGASYNKEVIDARLNISIWDASNTLQGKVRYGFTDADVTVPVSNAADMGAALTAAGQAGAGNTTIKLTNSATIDMSATAWTPIKVDGYNGADVITIEGNGATLKGLTAPLFAGGFAGGSGIVIKDLTIADSHIVSSNTLGSGAFIESIDSMEIISLDNCHLVNSTVVGGSGSRTGGLIGWTAGYNNVNDGAVKTKVNIENCSVVKCTITCDGSVGGLYGHAGNNAWTFSTVKNCTIQDCTLNSTDAGEWRVGVVVGTANVGEMTITGITESGNTLTQTGKTAPAGQSNLYGRFVPGSTGKLTIDGAAIQ